ncbi:M1 family metallopeptidase [Faecalibacter bovis]|uniref:M1 family metallopeptidase n=1 Tax=Faecalibacter bovis TaxID=2898187 RepID=A0ABX7X9U9_9FLAO|nr:M1 family metallopeptidase [Faecalibacter bovis]QTV04650.1 M1 family metallopeptidase [Faecalibacter bovis]
MKKLLLVLGLLSIQSQAQILNHKQEFTRQDTLRGSNTEYRNWWDVKHYKVSVEPEFKTKTIKGNTIISFDVIADRKSDLMQIDLQEPMQISSAKINGKKIKDLKREGNVYFIDAGKSLKKKDNQLELIYEGNPRVAQNAPWDGGWIFVKDEQGREWMSVACQGLGASVWFPNKDYGADEPDFGAELEIIVPNDLVGVGNGRLVSQKKVGNKTAYLWKVTNPINNYNIIPYIGKYVNFKDSYTGEKGKLDLDYYVIDYNLSKAKSQFEQAKQMLDSFEYWFGPYPFYEDSFKMIESPHLGMEHQSGIAYGNKYLNGYLGRDLSGTGWGLKWDFIIIHEAGHEWFGNNISHKDVADMWIHEGFTSYSEALHTEHLFGKQAGSDYVKGTRASIANEKPLIGVYGVNQEGPGDIYNKGANIIHTFRTWLNNDEKFRQILRGMNKEFYHQSVTTKQIEDYISKESGLDLTAFFNQYLRTKDVPVLEIKQEGNLFLYRYYNTVDGFNMPLRLENSDITLYPTKDWKELKNSNFKNSFEIVVDSNYYINTFVIK